MKRIIILGSPGSGKSTLATGLGAKLGSPVIHLDQVHWLPGWELRPKPEAYEAVAKLAQSSAWIMEGNWFHCMDVRLARADAVIFIDLPAWLCIISVIRRIVRTYGRVRSDMASGCPEQFDAAFLRYVWDYRRKGRMRAIKLISCIPDHIENFHLRSRGEVARFLASATSKAEPRS